MSVKTNTLFQNYLLDYSNYEELLTKDLKIIPVSNVSEVIDNILI